MVICIFLHQKYCTHRE